jgi:hypothetical protein
LSKDKKGFEKTQLRIKTRPLFEELKKTPFDFVEQKFEIEIIPFEICWLLFSEAIA